MGLSLTCTHLRRWVLLGVALCAPSAAWAVEVGSVEIGAVEDCQPSAHYQQRNLVSDGTVPAATVDPRPLEPWGMAMAPTGPVWVAHQGTGMSTVYNGSGYPQPLAVVLPPAADESGPSDPTGVVFNPSTGFVVRQGEHSGPARFLFATRSGTLAGWSPEVAPSHAVLAVDRSELGASYTGLALAGNGSAFYLYAADFANGRIDVFDGDFKPVYLVGHFMDPDLPEDYAPFGIHTLQGNLYVTYARRTKEDEGRVETGAGLGLVSVFDANGRFLRRVVSHGTLDAPWGLALAPADFGAFAHRLLVGNTGDGAIHAYDVTSGKWVGQLQRLDGSPLLLEGLRALSFGNGVLNQPTNALFFTASLEGMRHALFGRLEAGPCVFSYQVAPRGEEEGKAAPGQAPVQAQGEPAFLQEEAEQAPEFLQGQPE